MSRPRARRAPRRTGSTAGVRAAASLALALALAGCPGAPEGPPPYGLEPAPEQEFRFESDARLEVDGAPVRILAAGQVVQRALELEPSVVRVEYYLKSWAMRVEGAPGGSEELTIGPGGVVTRTGEQGEQRLPAEAFESGLELDRRPLGGVGFAPDGTAIEPVWVSTHPILFGVAVADWFVYALPPLGDGRARWRGERDLPRLGQYQLGIAMPLLLERDPADPETVRSTGTAERGSIELAQGFSGALSLEHTGRARFLDGGRLERADVRLQMSFESTAGARVTSTTLLTLRCVGCGSDVNPAASPADPARDGRVP